MSVGSERLPRTRWAASVTVGYGTAWLECILAIVLSIGMALALAASPTTALAILILGIAAVSMVITPAAYWAIAVVAVVVMGRELEALGLSGLLSFLDIPLAWFALGAALLRNSLAHQPLPIQGRRMLQLLILFVAVVTISWVLNGGQILRLGFFVALWGEPWVLAAAIVVDPPTDRQHRRLRNVVLALLAVQIPFVAVELLQFGPGDPVVGTLQGSKAGAHLVGFMALIGAMWLLSQRPLKRSYLLLAALFAAIPLASGAKQVLVAAPAAFLLVGWRGGNSISRLAIVTACIFGAFFFQPSQNAYSNNELLDASHSGKFTAAQTIWSATAGDPVKVLTGLGPASTFTHAAFLTADPVLKPSSPIRLLHLTPSTLALNSEIRLGSTSDSFSSEQTSWIGLVGDVGILGVLAFGSMLFYVVRRLRAVRDPLATSASYGLILLSILALIQDWWEEPAVTVVVAILIGLALTRRVKTPDLLEAGESGSEMRAAGAPKGS